jgi:hypothetical protein
MLLVMTITSSTQIYSAFSDSVTCHPFYVSTIAYPSVCISDKPLPIKITVTLKAIAPFFWFGNSDWFYYLVGKDGNK